MTSPYWDDSFCFWVDQIEAIQALPFLTVFMFFKLIIIGFIILAYCFDHLHSHAAQCQKQLKFSIWDEKIWFQTLTICTYASIEI